MSLLSRVNRLRTWIFNQDAYPVRGDAAVRQATDPRMVQGADDTAIVEAVLRYYLPYARMITRRQRLANAAHSPAKDR